MTTSLRRSDAPSLEPAAVYDALATVTPPPAALHEPEFAGNEWVYVDRFLGAGRR